MTTIEQPATPELDKIKKICDQSQAIGEFFDWCQGKGWFLGYHPLIRDLYPERYTEKELAKPINLWRRENMEEASQVAYPIGKDIQSLLAEFFDIDQAKAEQERLAVLEYVRELQEANPT